MVCIEAGAQVGGRKTDDRVAYFAGCTANYIEPDVGSATVLVLERNGLRPIFPRQGCCGAPLLSHADVKGFARRAEATVRSLGREACEVVTACTSCALALKHDYPRWLKTEEAESLAVRTYDVVEYLTTLQTAGRLDTAFHRLELDLIYHAPCHLRALGMESIERRVALLDAVPGVSVRWIDRGCCGMAGTFGMKRVNYEMSMTIGRPLFDEIRRSAPDVVVTECPACKMQIEQATGVAVLHPVQIIQRAYRLWAGSVYERDPCVSGIPAGHRPLRGS